MESKVSIQIPLLKHLIDVIVFYTYFFLYKPILGMKVTNTYDFLSSNNALKQNFRVKLILFYRKLGVALFDKFII